jgi:hypothetical protein
MIQTKLIAKFLPKKIQNLCKPFTKNGEILGGFHYSKIIDMNAHFIFEQEINNHYLQSLEIQLFELVSFTHLKHTWNCGVWTGLDKQGNKIYTFAQIDFMFVKQ